MKINPINQINFGKQYMKGYLTGLSRETGECHVYKLDPKYDCDYIDRLEKSEEWQDSAEVEDSLFYENFLYKASPYNLSINKFSTYAIENEKHRCLGIAQIIDDFCKGTRDTLYIINPDLGRVDKKVVHDVFDKFLNSRDKK